jgi:hypothetical protein
MKNGPGRFTFYLQKAGELMRKAGEQGDPSMWLFSNNARTPFFMLESLAKLYAEIHDSKKFGKLKEHFKLIEDSLGQIDYYHSLSLAFEGNNKIPAEFIGYFKGERNRLAAQTDEFLTEKGWLSADNRRINKISNKLNETDWLEPDNEIVAICNFYKKSVDSVCRFAAKTGYRFDDVEEDVHELRRKLRWLSIYPQALQGAVQYAPVSRANDYLAKYLTDDIINSPFNRLPDAGTNKHFLLLDKNCFMALSWMIAKLGSLKDEGLLLAGLCESIEKCTGCSAGESLERAYALLGSKQRPMHDILADASSVSRTYFEENSLLHLIGGIVRPV